MANFPLPNDFTVWYNSMRALNSPLTPSMIMVPKSEPVEVITLEFDDDCSGLGDQSEKCAEQQTENSPFLIKSESEGASAGEMGRGIPEPQPEVIRKKREGKKVTGSKKKQCDICKRQITYMVYVNDKICQLPSKLRQHVLIHSEKSLFGCPNCNHSAKTVDRLKTHMHQAHGMVPGSFPKPKIESEKRVNDEIEFLMGQCFNVGFHGEPLETKEEQKLVHSPAEKMVVGSVKIQVEPLAMSNKLKPLVVKVCKLEPLAINYSEISLPVANIKRELCEESAVTQLPDSACNPRFAEEDRENETSKNPESDLKNLHEKKRLSFKRMGPAEPSRGPPNSHQDQAVRCKVCHRSIGEIRERTDYKLKVAKRPSPFILRGHASSHMDEKVYQCSTCLFAARTYKAVDSHIRKKHGGVASSQYRITIPMNEYNEKVDHLMKMCFGVDFNGVPSKWKKDIEVC